MEKLLCFHNTRGYYVGCYLLGRVKRISVEYFPSETDCLQAIHEHRWTQRFQYNMLN